MSPRLLRFLLVYVLVGLTFTALSSGATERIAQRDHFDGAAWHFSTGGSWTPTAAIRQACRDLMSKKWVASGQASLVEGLVLADS